MTRRRTVLTLEDADALETTPAEAPQDEAGTGEDPVAPAPEAPEYWEDDAGPGGLRRDRVITVITFLMLAVWTGFYGWVRYPDIAAGTSPSLLASSIFEWVVPILLVLVLWQLAIRSGRSEQARFADTAAMLSFESAELEARLTAVNRELSLAREFIASQSRDLEALGRVATERLTGNAERLEALIATNSDRIETIGQVGESAIVNMERLRDQLPVLANSARDMTNQIGNAGNVAQGHFDKFLEAFQQIDQFGEKSEAHVEKIGVLVEQTLDTLDRQASEVGQSTMATFENLNRQSEEFRQTLYERDREALAEIRKRAEELTTFLEGRNERLHEIEQSSTRSMRERLSEMIGQSDQLLRDMVARRDEASRELHGAIEALEQRLTEAVEKVADVDKGAMDNARARLAALAEEANRIDATIAQSAASFDEDLARRRDDLRKTEAESLDEIEQRLAAFDNRLSEREASHLAHIESLAERGDRFARRLADMDTALANLSTQSNETREDIGNGADLLAQRLGASRALLEENGTAIGKATEDSVRLLEIIRSGAEHADGDLAAAIGRARVQLEEFNGDAAKIRDLIEAAEQRGAALAEHVEVARDHGSNTLGILEQLEDQLNEVAGKSSELAAQARDELQRALDRLTARSATALEDLRDRQAETIREIADSIAREGNSALAEALGKEAQTTIEQLADAARNAGEAGRETTQQLRDQLGRLNELTSNLEQRVAVARERAEEQVDHDFSRRLALITEALNSSAIDISRAFDNDVADTQWANYLRGDRGIFTRRAVRLLDKHEARAIHEVYAEDAEFRETVNRYIHDFEAMLRQVLSTRDGNAVAVTLLSSDIGKLYVALAQAIDRLRD